MLEKPKLADSAIVAQLEKHYGLKVGDLAFLPVGNDARAWSYRVETGDAPYFLKLRRGKPTLAALHVPHFLRRRGIPNAVAPIAAGSGALAVPVEDYSLILYPFIKGESAWGMELTSAQWRAWGAIVRSIHETRCDQALLAIVPRERFAQKWLATIAAIESAIEIGSFTGEAASAVAQVWRRQSAQIASAKDRYLALGQRLMAQRPRFVLCHADIHTANIIIDERDAIHIVDWDETLLAPKERDLMFFLGDGHSDEAELAFTRGYGACHIDRAALAYYRYDWVLQELADYGERLFLSKDVGKRDLALARAEFEKLFAPGDVVDRARQAYARVGTNDDGAGAQANRQA